jgi:hypothetical protein
MQPLLPLPVIPHYCLLLSAAVATVDIIVNLLLPSLITTASRCRRHRSSEATSITTAIAFCPPLPPSLFFLGWQFLKEGKEFLSSLSLFQIFDRNCDSCLTGIVESCQRQKISTSSCVRSLVCTSRTTKKYLLSFAFLEQQAESTTVPITIVTGANI